MIRTNPLKLIKDILDKDIINDRGSLFYNGHSLRINSLGFARGDISLHDRIIHCVGYENGESVNCITFGWNKSPNIEIIFSEMPSICFFEMKDGGIGDKILEIFQDDLNDDLILQLTLGYSISKIELSDEEYKFIYGE